MLNRLLFPRYDNLPPTYSLLLLLGRVSFGILFLMHGLDKLLNYNQIVATFPDPLGIGREMSLILSIFAELICSLFFIAGLLFRIVLFPMIFSMAIALFVVHASQPFAAKELACIYMIVFTLLWLTGPGEYAFDQFLIKRNEYSPEYGL